MVHDPYAAAHLDKLSKGYARQQRQAKDRDARSVKVTCPHCGEESRYEMIVKMHPIDDAQEEVSDGG